MRDVVVNSFVTLDGVMQVITTYRRAGEIDPGSFAFETPTDAELSRRQRLAAEDAASRRAR